MHHIPSLYIAQTETKGRGVFTAMAIPAGTSIELCPVVFFSAADKAHMDETALYDYYFVWPDGERFCLALGYGSLYNHDAHANAEVVFDLESEEIIIQAVRDIEAGEEICIHYLGDDSSTMPYWMQG